MNGGPANGGTDSESGRPSREPAPLTERRLLDVPGAADYLSLAPDTIRELLDRGVLIREVGPAGWLRVSVGTPQETAAFKAALVEVAGL